MFRGIPSVEECREILELEDVKVLSVEEILAELAMENAYPDRVPEYSIPCSDRIPVVV